MEAVAVVAKVAKVVVEEVLTIAVPLLVQVLWVGEQQSGVYQGQNQVGMRLVMHVVLVLGPKIDAVHSMDESFCNDHKSSVVSS